MQPGQVRGLGRVSGRFTASLTFSHVCICSPVSSYFFYFYLLFNRLAFFFFPQFHICYIFVFPPKPTTCNSLTHMQVMWLIKWLQNANVSCRFKLYLMSLHHVRMCIINAFVWQLQSCHLQVKHLTDDIAYTHTLSILHVGCEYWVHTPAINFFYLTYTAGNFKATLL